MGNSSQHSTWGAMMRPNVELPRTSILLVDGSKNHRAHWADQLKCCSPAYEILEAADGQSALDIYRSRPVDCVVLELSLPDQSGFETLVELVPVASRPQVPVIVLTLITHRGVWDLAKQQGAQACFHKQSTATEDLDRAIQRAVALVKQIPKEDRGEP